MYMVLNHIINLKYVLPLQIKHFKTEKPKLLRLVFSNAEQSLSMSSFAVEVSSRGFTL